MMQRPHAAHNERERDWQIGRERAQARVGASR